MHGTNGFDVVEFVEYVYERRIAFLISCGVAILLALVAGLILPKRYTAKSSVLIEAPVDPRAATVLSPAYLESLKTYESFAASDTLFLRAVENLHLKASKASALKVSRPISTTVIEINATLDDPGKAQALTRYIAEQTVELNKTIEGKSADDLLGELRRQSQEALDRLTETSRSREAFAASSPIEALEQELRDGFEFEFRLEQDIARAQTDIAEYAGRQSSEAGPVRQTAAVQARIEALEARRHALGTSLAAKGAQLDARKNRRAELEDEQQAARTAYEEARTRLNNTLASPQFRGMRLHVIDPGIVPQNPSFPNTPLNMVAALIAALMGTFAWLLLRFAWVRMQRERSERLYSLH